MRRHQSPIINRPLFCDFPHIASGLVTGFGVVEVRGIAPAAIWADEDEESVSPAEQAIRLIISRRDPGIFTLYLQIGRALAAIAD